MNSWRKLYTILYWASTVKDVEEIQFWFISIQ